MSTSRTAVGLIVSAGLLLGGGVAAGALAASGALASATSATPSPTASSGATKAPGDGGPGFGHHRHGGTGPGLPMRGGLGRVLHGEVVVATDGGGTQTVLVQHGSVTAKTSDTVTVKSTDGFTVTWKVTADTRIRAGAPTSPGAGSGTLADVATGAAVMVWGPKTAGGGTATMLGVRPAGVPDRTPDGTKTRRGGVPTPRAATTSPAVLTG